MNVRDEVLALAAKELGAAAPAQDADLSEALDSVQRLQLVVAIEDHFQICFEPEDDATVLTLDDVVAVVQRHLADA